MRLDAQMRSLALGFALLSAATITVTSQQSELVTVAVVGPTEVDRVPGVEVSVVNHTSDYVLAWDVEVIVKLTNGKTDHQRMVRDRLGALAEPSPTTPLPAPGGGSVKEVFLVSLPAGVSIQSVTARLLCAIFADGSWVGDSVRVDNVFANRSREEAAQTFMLGAIEAGRAVGGRNGLRKALEVLNDPAQSDFNYPGKNGMRLNLQRALDNHPSIKVSPDEFLEWWLQRTDSYRAVAAASRQRLGPRTPNGLGQ